MESAVRKILLLTTCLDNVPMIECFQLLELLSDLVFRFGGRSLVGFHGVIALRLHVPSISIVTNPFQK